VCRQTQNSIDVVRKLQGVTPVLIGGIPARGESGEEAGHEHSAHKIYNASTLLLLISGRIVSPVKQMLGLQHSANHQINSRYCLV
jgi:hypothetical protein